MRAAFKFLAFAGAAALAAAAAFGAYKAGLLAGDGGFPPEGITAVNGRLEMKRIDVAALYGGRIEQMNVDRGDAVAKGQSLAVLNADDAEADLRAAEAALARAAEGAAGTKARIRGLEEEIRLARIELADAEKLRADRLVSATELERARTALATRLASLEGLGRELAGAETEVKRAGALRDKAAARLNDMTVRSPIDAVVEYRLADPGNVVGAGGRIVSILDPSDVTMDVFLNAGTAAGVRLGDEARIVLDGSAAVVPARVDYIARDAQFTPKYVETKEERAKLLFRVTLRIDPELALAYPLYFRGGMPGVGYVNHGAAAWPARLAPDLSPLEKSGTGAPPARPGGAPDGSRPAGGAGPE